jgi:NAD(P)-dependent dehydrogenase (short-subunit alcohol dehydrogenase family)
MQTSTERAGTVRGRLVGKAALVSGAASGIGRAMCQLFAEEGARVVCADVDRTGAEETARNIGPAAAAAKCDVSVPEDARQAVAIALERFGGLQVLVNNAAVFSPHSSVDAMNLDEWNRALAVNLTGAMLMSKYAVPVMRRSGGSIVHVASQLGHVGRAGRACYGMTKAGLIHLATAMAVDHAGDGIRVNSLSPGPVSTERVVRDYGGPDEHASRVGPMTLIGRAGTVEEIARAALFLASDESSFMTGVDLLVDGGYTAR